MSTKLVYASIPIVFKLNDTFTSITAELPHSRSWPIDLVRHRNSAILSIPTLCIEDRLVYLQPHSLNGSNNVGQYRECKLDQSKHFMMEVYLGTSPQSRVPVFG